MAYTFSKEISISPTSYLMPTELHTFVAGRALEHDETFNVKCNCNGNAPIRPESTAGYGFSKRGPSVRVVDKLVTKCLSCGAKITVNVLEGDPGYVLTGGEGREQLFCPQGSTSRPVDELSAQEQAQIIANMKDQFNRHQRNEDGEQDSGGNGG